MSLSGYLRMCCFSKLYSMAACAQQMTDVSQILTRCERWVGMSYAKEIVSASSAVWAQCMNVTDRQTDYGMVTSIAIGKISCQRWSPKVDWIDFIRDNYKMNVKRLAYGAWQKIQNSVEELLVCVSVTLPRQWVDFSWWSAWLINCPCYWESEVSSLTALQVCRTRRWIEWWTMLRSIWWWDCICRCSVHTWPMTRSETWRFRLASAVFTGSRPTCWIRPLTSRLMTWEICLITLSLVS